MYQPFFGLRERPFDLTPDPRYLFLSASHQEALSNLEYGLRGRKGITLLIGEAGMGKTTLVRAVLGSFKDHDALCVYISNPTLTRTEFLETLAQGFRLGDAAARDKAVCLRELQRVLTERSNAGGLSALMVDEAQSLPHELLEEVRLLSNLETDTAKLLPIILAGQPELADRLNEASLRQLKQRVALRCSLQPFDLRRTAAYIATRLRTAGGDAATIFTREAVCRIHEASGGIPRVISVICDNAMLAGLAAGVRPVDSRIVRDVCHDFDLRAVTPVTMQQLENPGEVPDDRMDAASLSPESPSAAAATDEPAAAAPVKSTFF
jgi:general secretion pathway protein A